MLISIAIHAQEFKNTKTGQTLNILTDIDKGQLVTYRFAKQGVFTFKSIDIDFENIMTINKKTITIVPGGKLKKKQVTLSVVLRLFRDSGYTLESRDSYTKRFGDYERHITELNFVRN